MADCSPSVSQQFSEINGINIKIVQERFAALMAQGAEDNQINARQTHALTQRTSEASELVKHLAQLNFITSAQTGQTENQQTDSPGAVAAGETAKDTVAAANAQLAANIAETVSGLSDVVVKFSDAMSALTVLITSQTQPRSPAAA